MYLKSLAVAIHPNLAWCSSTRWWHSGLGPSGTARARSQGHAWTREQQSPTTCIQGSAVTGFGFLQSAPGTTSSLGGHRANLIAFLYRGTSISKEPVSPVSWLDVKKAGLMSARNKFDAGSRGNLLHSCFNCDSIHVIYRWKTGPFSYKACLSVNPFKLIHTI